MSCKFTNRLFIFIIIQSIYFYNFIDNHPISKRKSFLNFFGDYFEDEEISDTYDLKYDQRQNGTDNIRVNLDGFLIALPSGVASSVVTADDILSLLGRADDRPLLGYTDEDSNKDKVQSVKIINQNENANKNSAHNDAQQSNDSDSLDEQHSSKSADYYNKNNKNNKKQKPKLHFMNLLKMLRRNRRE